MKKDHWMEAALTNDSMVAEFLLRLKHSPFSDSLNAPLPSTSDTQTKGFKLPYWGHRKNRSKSTATISNVTNGIRKEHRGSPTTHLSWSGGGGSTSDGYDESSRPSDLSSGGRSIKESASMRVTSNHEMDTNEKIKRIKIDFDQNRRNEMGRMVDDDRKKKAATAQSCRSDVEEERWFVLPDLNMMPNEEDTAAMMMMN